MDSVLGIPEETYKYMNEFGMNAYVLGILVLVLVVYYLFFSKLVRVSSTGEKSIYAKTLEIGLWGVFIVLVLLNGMQYFFNINFVASIGSLFKENPKLDLKIKEMTNYDKESNANLGQVSASGAGGAGGAGGVGGVDASISKTSVSEMSESSEMQSMVSSSTTKASDSGSNNKKGDANLLEMSGKEGVFNIPSNSFSYEDSKKVCKAYGARLATYNEIEKAYTDGADWCSYGWSDSQMVLYPTQKGRWEKLQEIEGHENDCGRPGVNGGYIDNPNAHFGINCYGDRPEAREEDKERMKNTVIYPKTEAEIKFEKEVEGWRKKLDKIEVSPFNPTSWDS